MPERHGPISSLGFRDQPPQKSFVAQRELVHCQLSEASASNESAEVWRQAPRRKLTGNFHVINSYGALHFSLSELGATSGMLAE